MKNDSILQLKQLLSKAENLVIIPHENPDGDAMGSTLALFEFLKNKGKSVSLITPNDYPGFLKNLPHSDKTINFEESGDQAKKLIQKADVIFTLDFNQLSRTRHIQGSLEQANADFVMIDHHQEPTDYAKLTFSETTASSTCELLYQIIDNLGEAKNVTSTMAKCLYLGIMTDTGSFRFTSTTSATHRVVASLIDAGVKPEEIHEQIFDNNSLNKLKLQAHALSNLEVIEERRTAFTFLSDDEMNSLQTKKGDTEGIVNMGLSIEGIRFAAFFKERQQEGLIKISLRSKGEFDVNKVARKHFEGGGHKNAAGGKSEKSLEDTLDYFKNEVIPDYKNQLE